ncbi:cupin domain-containing protein [Mesorhizobium kowhaii]|uniref:Cupin n=1 Tax=Mesorhizobium kowhaii TaxID=1300272 RepID=A0A2W7C8C3_9HYPH|nr:cupin domain-containing protein [Mesorhizobium kowhaii]PZV39410.1 cupin [Mesorhizobium kowhaii]
MIDFQTFAHLASIDLGEPEPKPTSISGDQLEASRTLWTSPDGTLEVGVWACTPGRFTATRDSNSETCHIVSGRVSLHGPDGRSKEVGAGEMLVLPKGWKGEWTIHEPTRKLYILHFEAA